MNNDEDIRFVGKRFRCTKCNEKFTKLVKPNEISSNCKNFIYSRCKMPKYSKSII